MINLFALYGSLLLVFFNGCGNQNQTSRNNLFLLSHLLKVRPIKAPGSIEIADFNKDKIPDLAITSELDSNVTILLGDGKGKFGEAAGSPFFAGHIPNDIAVGDFNNDGNPDLIFANHERKYLTVLLGLGDGGFAASSKSPFPVEVLPHTHGVATGDFNGDYRLDIVTDSWGNDKVEVLFGDSINLFKTPGTFINVGRHPYQRLRVADLNNDGIADIVTTNLEGNNVTILLGNGKGNFNSPHGSPFSCGDAPFGVAIGDLNADGNPDLAIINSPASTGGASEGINGLTILLGDGKGKFTVMEGSPFNSGKIPNRVAIGDVNGDTINDVVTSDNSANKIYLFLMNKNGSVQSQSSIIVGNHPKGVAIADLNNDGRGDIVICNNSDNNISVIMGK